MVARSQSPTGTSAGTVVLTPAGVRSSTGGILLGSLLPTSAASFTATGALNAIYSIALPASATLTSSNGKATLTVTPFACSAGPLGQLNATGTQQLSVGGTLLVPAAQASGDYSGTFALTVAYN